ncbi:MAG: hypothetical protein NTU63_03985 [Candidatus Pacearchaeota archaeon]|nr:hypothetical protein [Candidatus Pacearchaeota archaeon]
MKGGKMKRRMNRRGQLATGTTDKPKEVPVGVKIISILGYIGSGFLLLAGIILMVGGEC